MTKPIRFTAYARAKFAFLRRHEFSIAEDDVRRAILHPERVTRGHTGRWVAQRAVDAEHLIRVIYEESPHERIVITFYPARRSRYESAHDL